MLQPPAFCFFAYKNCNIRKVDVNVPAIDMLVEGVLVVKGKYKMSIDKTWLLRHKS